MLRRSDGISNAPTKLTLVEFPGGQGRDVPQTFIVLCSTGSRIGFRTVTRNLLGSPQSDRGSHGTSALTMSR
jgi:hypothetical protein